MCSKSSPSLQKSMMMQAAPIPAQASFPSAVKAPTIDVQPEAVILSRAQSDLFITIALTAKESGVGHTEYTKKQSEGIKHKPDLDPSAGSKPSPPPAEVAKKEVPETLQETPDLPVLHDLTPVDRLLITKRLRIKNVLFLRGKRNRWWVGYFCYGLRPLQLRVTNSQGTEVMRINRPYSCTARVLPCQLQRLEIYSPPGQLIGSVEQQWTAVKPTYLVKNDNGVDVFWIQGPYITLSCFRDVQFQIQRPDGTSVGATCKRWQGLTHALFFAPVCDKFGVAFERSLSVEEKGLLLAATLLMDYMYYDA